MNARMWILLTLATGLSTVAMATEPPDPSKEVSIPFVNHGSINDWRADKRQGLWIQDGHRQWYYAKTFEPCLGLDFAETLAFDTSPSGTLDRFSSIIVPREGRCHLQSLVRSGPPPKKLKHTPEITTPP